MTLPTVAATAVVDPCEALYCDETIHWIEAGRAL
jgi:hypothetical protein